MFESFSSQASGKRNFFVYQAVSYNQNRSLYDQMCCYRCTRISSEMGECSNCLKLACDTCISSRNPCPNCNHSIYNKLVPFKQNAFYQIGFKCKYETYGCQTVLNILEMPNHETRCSYQVASQQNQQNNVSSNTQIDLESTMAESEVIVRENPSEITGLLQALRLDESNEPAKPSQYEVIQHLNQVIIDLKEEIKQLKEEKSIPYKELCPFGHKLHQILFNTDGIERIVCDICQVRPQDQFIGSYRCMECDFDRCELCYEKGRLY